MNTDDQNLTQNNNREKDPRSLSGGEKSFSTICLLLSLWESIGCPIRCLGTSFVFLHVIGFTYTCYAQMSSTCSWMRSTAVLV